MFVRVVEFVGWSQKERVREHTVSDFSTGHRVFELAVGEALSTNMDVASVHLVIDGVTDREIIFYDRRIARED